MSDVRTIKRYSNRKLYDLKESRYVTLQDVAIFLQNGDEVRIIDNKSKEDITSVTLAQILYEQEKNQANTLPLGTLKHIIASSGELFQKRLAKPVKAFRRESEKTVATLKEETERRVQTIREEAERKLDKFFVNSQQVKGEALGVVMEVRQATQTTLDELSKALDEKFLFLNRFARHNEDSEGAMTVQILERLENMNQTIRDLRSRVEKLENQVNDKISS